MGKIKRLLSLLPSFFLLFSFAFTEPLPLFLMLVFSLGIHELGHGLAFLHYSGRYAFFRGQNGGFLLYCQFPLSEKEEFWTALLGPLMNLICFVVFLFLARFFRPEAAILLSGMNLLTGLVNLIPFRGSDGALMLEIMLRRCFSSTVAQKLCGSLAGLLGALLFFVSVYLYYYGKVSLLIPLFSTIVLIRSFPFSKQKRCCT